MGSLNRTPSLPSTEPFSSLELGDAFTSVANEGPLSYSASFHPPIVVANDEKMQNQMQSAEYQGVQPEKGTMKQAAGGLQETKRNSCSGSPCSHLLFSPQTAADVKAMREALDRELMAKAQEEPYLPLPPVTHVWGQKLYVGGLPDSESLGELRELGITHIINCSAGDCPSPLELKSEFTVVEFDPSDRSNYPILFLYYNSFSLALNSIFKEPEAKVFVHCIAGVNRSVCLCAAYLMKVLQTNPVEAIKIIHANGRSRIL